MTIDRFYEESKEVIKRYQPDYYPKEEEIEELIYKRNGMPRDLDRLKRYRGFLLYLAMKDVSEEDVKTRDEIRNLVIKLYGMEGKVKSSAALKIMNSEYSGTK